ncbi:MAG: hypothetical protein FWG45_07325 [Oscillospiraceae bacterium]|nr:hypothetical protein [Oscillospiraceae bacterium]
MKQDNSYQIEGLSGTIERAARCLQGTMGYLSTISENRFYDINVKDVFKISLSDIGNPDIVGNLGIRPDPRFSARNEPLGQLTDLMFYAFAVRAPFLRRSVTSPKSNDKLLADLFAACLSKGANDRDGIVAETFKANMKAAKSKRTEPTFNGEWFRRWVYSQSASNGVNVAAINNPNLFMLGCMDALLPLYYAKLTEVLLKEISGVV